MDERESGRTWRPNRKEFIAGTTLASLGFVFADGTPARAAWDDKPTVKKPVSANDKIRFACIGVGGKGWGEVMDSAENGDIVAALLEDEATVKTFKQRDGHTWLLPRNSEFEPILGDHAVILGKVVAVLRSI